MASRGLISQHPTDGLRGRPWHLVDSSRRRKECHHSHPRRECRHTRRRGECRRTRLGGECRHTRLREECRRTRPRGECRLFSPIPLPKPLPNGSPTPQTISEYSSPSPQTIAELFRASPLKPLPNFPRRAPQTIAEFSLASIPTKTPKINPKTTADFLCQFLVTHKSL